MAATALALPGVIAAVASRVPVPVDGGVRRVPTWRRPWGRTPCWSADLSVWGLATSAAPGVARVVEILRTELEMAMGLLGTPRLGAHRLDALRPDALWP
ncbi:MAG: alpha-hydroxy-acid oxidizing protein [Actinomycetes bacterium]